MRRLLTNIILFIALSHGVIGQIMQYSLGNGFSQERVAEDFADNDHDLLAINHVPSTMLFENDSGGYFTDIK